MKRTFTVTMMVVALAMSTMAMAIAGPADKVTGSGTWENDWGSYYGEFNAHEAVGEPNEKGYRAAKGDLFQDRGDGSFRVDVTGVVVGDDYACFWGPAYDGTGAFETQDGQSRWTYVTAGDGPGSGEFRGGWGNASSACKNGNTDMVDSFAFEGGNFTIHSGKAHQQ